ncbi:hypothetical protein BYT27DRAFT_7190309 [Phlegmacium glaucopus]|nr:hypothetical protein BYT27DRAFT_7190309 [Phlegmacium glaucopus]
MVDGTVAQHPPAMKVGGRRLSISMKHKAPTPAEAVVTTPGTEDKKETTVPDYPRPAPPTAGGETPQHQQVHRTEEELPPKKEKKYNHDNEKKVQEYSHWKTEITRPTRDISGGNKGQTMGVRIGQPAGKAFGA